MASNQIPLLNVQLICGRDPNKKIVLPHLLPTETGESVLQRAIDAGWFSNMRPVGYVLTVGGMNTYRKIFDIPGQNPVNELQACVIDLHFAKRYEEIVVAPLLPGGK